jgi:N-acetylglucosaminyl-diphospho-decaprenol L-rhamnosyltransferase
VGEGLAAVAGQLRDGDELIVVDNASRDGTVEAARSAAPDATVVETGANLGYGAANNRGAEIASGDLLVFLNPDAVVRPGFRDAIALPLTEARDWAAWQGLVTAEGGRIVNTRGGVVHFTAIAWAGGAGEPLLPPEWSTGSGSDVTQVWREAEPGFVSGACLAVPRASFEAAGRFPGEFFLYHEDVDLSLRLRLAGGRLGVEPEARIDHEYEFAKGPAKWRLLERNRWATLIRTYPAALLALLAPALLATELALVPVAITGGWFRQKALAWGDTARSLPRLARERRAIQRTRTIGAGEFARALVADLDSAYLGAPSRSRLIRLLLRAYWSVVLALLGGSRSPATG